MDRHIIFDRARRYLAAELGCDVSELSGSGTVYVANERAKAPFIKLAAMGERVIASASPELLPKVRELTEGRSRDEIFELPLVYGQTIHFVPDRVPDIPLPGGYEYRLLEGDGVYELSGIEGFPNSLAFDKAGHTGTGIVLFAKSGDERSTRACGRWAWTRTPRIVVRALGRRWWRGLRGSSWPGGARLSTARR